MSSLLGVNYYVLPSGCCTRHYMIRFFLSSGISLDMVYSYKSHYYSTGIKMASLTSDSILLNPLPEIIAALTSSSFGILPAPDSQPLLEQTFPRTAEELKSVQEESNRSRKMSERVVGMCRVGLLDGEGHVVIRLDRAGWTVSRFHEAPFFLFFFFFLSGAGRD